MIYAFTGKTGSGKTWQMVNRAYKEWLAGRDIYSNTILLFDQRHPYGDYTLADDPKCFSLLEKALYQTRKIILIGLNYIRRRKNRVATDQIKAMIMPRRGRIVYFQQILEIMEVSDGLILFDEAQVIFNARLWESLPPEFQYKLQQHRKHNLDLICTTQNMGTVDITYRRLVHGWYHCERGFTIGNEPVKIGLFHLHEKDIDQLYNQIDDLKADTITSHWFIIHKWKKKLYDTHYDVGFNRLKILFINVWSQEKMKFQMRWMIIPKNLSLANAQRVISSLKTACGVNKFSNSKTTWKKS